MNSSAGISEKLIYRLGYGSFRQFVKVSVTICEVVDSEIEVFLSSWRPGRYELGNFAKNVRHFSVTSLNGVKLPFQKISKDRWKVLTDGSSSIVIEYEYYAIRPDAGSCWLNEDVFYVNPIHCCIGIKGMEHLPCRVILDIPESFIAATSMTIQSANEFMVQDFDELVDSPILASPSLLHHSYSENGIRFHVWFYGIDKIDWEKVIHDFRSFTIVQLKTMGDFPVSKYHFLTLALPFRFYHGVEHLKSTVLALGPADELMHEKLYPELIGVASHELFHVWNVKTIRPAEMLPYNYSSENYSSSGWVYEGITTYYGDLFLARSGFFTHEAYFAEIATRLQKHLDNPGKENYNVLESSFDTWLDGYEPGVPGRKTSIYDEGSLIALIVDLYIRIHQPGKSLDDFVRLLYERFGKTGTGYTPPQLIQLLNEITGNEKDAFFEQMLNFKGSYLPVLNDLFKNLAIEIRLEVNPQLHERLAGFRLVQSSPHPRVSVILPDSPAEKSGLMHGDEVLEMQEEHNSIILSVQRFNRTKKIGIVTNTSNNFLQKVRICRMANPSSDQDSLFRSWITGLR